MHKMSHVEIRDASEEDLPTVANRSRWRKLANTLRAFGSERAFACWWP
jgi:hypothetical protein